MLLVVFGVVAARVSRFALLKRKLITKDPLLLKAVAVLNNSRLEVILSIILSRILSQGV
jgi:hypothetical protein